MYTVRSSSDFYNKYSGRAFLQPILFCLAFILANVLSKAGEATDESYDK